jgi:hypothetical protein
MSGSDVRAVSIGTADAPADARRAEALVAEALAALREADGAYTRGDLTLPELLAVAQRVEQDLEELLPLIDTVAIARAITGAAVEHTVAAVRTAYLGRRGV